MIHVLNPYQLSTSMFRLAAFTFEAQISFVRAFTHMTTHANPIYVTREAILEKGRKDSKVGAIKPVTKPKTKTPPVTVVAKTVAPKPAAKTTKPAAKTTTTRKKAPAKLKVAEVPAPAPAPEATKPVAKVVKPEPVAKDSAPAAPTTKAATPAPVAKTEPTQPAPAATKSYRAPSKPPEMPLAETAKTEPDSQK